mmetsp:Transcript_47722/g.34976  ORF Transcript_47722/g.34976 Transcript_47722/m.34976 type:complete len:135 (+) Transcript_47722:419-823(+)
MQSQLTSSLLDTSEDEREKQKLAEREAKKAKKGLTDKELTQLIDIELAETNTFELLFIPGIIVAHETEEYAVIQVENQKYNELKENKKGSDLYTERGSQTLNLTQKNRDHNFKGFTQTSREIQVTKFDIDDAAR